MCGIIAIPAVFGLVEDILKYESCYQLKMALPLEHLQLGDAAETVLYVATQPCEYRCTKQMWQSLCSVFRQVIDLAGLEVMLNRMGLAISPINLRHLVACDEAQHRHKPARKLCIAIVRLHPDKVGLTRESPEYIRLSSIATSLEGNTSLKIPSAAAAAPLRVESATFVPRPGAFVVPQVAKSCLGIIATALERAPASDLCEIFRRFVVAGYVSRVQFSTTCNIDCGNFYTWLKSEHPVDHGECYNNVRDQLLALFSDAYTIPYPPPAGENKEIRVERNPPRVIEGVARHRIPEGVLERIRLTTRAMVNPTTECTAALEPEELQAMRDNQTRFLDEALADLPDVVVLIDADNGPWSAANIHKFTGIKVRIWVFVNVHSYKRGAGIVRYLTDCACVIVPLIMCKDTVDTVMCMHAGMLHARMPAHIPFVCVSADGFGYSCVEALRFWGRTCGLVRYPTESLCLYLLRFMPELSWNEDARELSAAIQPLLADYYQQIDGVTTCREQFYDCQKPPSIRSMVRAALHDGTLILSDSARALLMYEIM